LQTIADFKRRRIGLWLLDLGNDCSGNGISELIMTVLAAVAQFERGPTSKKNFSKKIFAGVTDTLTPASGKTSKVGLGGCPKRGTTTSVPFLPPAPQSPGHFERSLGARKTPA
jgi:hypothetical protein